MVLLLWRGRACGGSPGEAARRPERQRHSGLSPGVPRLPTRAPFHGRRSGSGERLDAWLVSQARTSRGRACRRSSTRVTCASTARPPGPPPACASGQAVELRCPGAPSGGAKAGGHRAPRGLRGRRPDRGRQAGRPGRAPRRGHARGHPRERAAAPREEPVGGGRRAAAGHRAPPRQGHLGPARGGEARRGPSRPRASSSRAARSRRSTWPSSWASPGAKAGTVDRPIGRDPRDRKKMSVRASRGREARSTWTLVEAFDGAALLRVRIHTGRTHQIRVHLASLNHPVAGDATYGGTRTPPRADRPRRGPRSRASAVPRSMRRAWPSPTRPRGSAWPSRPRCPGLRPGRGGCYPEVEAPIRLTRWKP